MRRSLSTTQFAPNPKEEREQKKLREQTFDIRLELAKLVSRKNLSEDDREKMKRLRTILKARESPWDSGDHLVSTKLQMGLLRYQSQDIGD